MDASPGRPESAWSECDEPVSPSVEQDVEVPNPQGFHVRPAQMVTATAGQFGSEITIRLGDGEPVNAKHMMQVLMLAAPQGSRLRIRASGADAAEAVAALVDLVARGFDEMEGAGQALAEGGDER